MDIVITLPAKINWADYQRELDVARQGGRLLFKVNSFPTQASKGDRCYILHQGEIKGWMRIVDFTEESFTCSTTGTKWKGKFIVRSGIFRPLEKPWPMKGFQGFRYIDRKKIQ